MTSMAPAQPAPPKVKRPSLRILAGLLAGVAVGLFFGEGAAVLQPVADLYIRGMQMTVLPYLVLTLVGGLGQLDPATARRLGLRAAALLGLLIVLACAVIVVMPLAYPALVSASFYSDALIEPAQPFALGELYVPSNPFYAMANAIVPGLVLFSSAVGVALIGVPDKAPLLASLRALERAVVRVTQLVLSLTPYGVFAISASVAGTMSPESLGRLEIYFVLFGAAALLLAFVVIPLAVAALTPFGWRQVVGMCQEALLTAFIANSAFIVLPMLVEKVKAALAAQAMDSTDTRSAVDVVVPISFVVPNAGKLLTLLFVPFAAWLAGDPLGVDAYLALFGAGIPSYFAKAQVALPFLMDLLDVPHDLFRLYIPSSIITGKFDSMVTVMSLLALALLTASAVSGRLRIEPRRIARALLITLAATVVTVGGLKLGLAHAIDTVYRKDEALKNMNLPRVTLPIALLAEAPPAEAVSTPALQRIRARGVLRVAFVGDRVPFAFVNARGDLVGMDVELAQRLAQDLGATRVDFVPADFGQMARLLRRRPHRRGAGPALPARTADAGGLFAALPGQHAGPGGTRRTARRVRLGRPPGRALAGDHRVPGRLARGAGSPARATGRRGPAFRRTVVAEGLLRRQGAAGRRLRDAGRGRRGLVDPVPGLLGGGAAAGRDRSAGRRRHAQGRHRTGRRGQRLARDPAQRRGVEPGARLLGARTRRPEERPPLVDPP